MANYYLLTFDASQESIRAIRKTPDAGSLIETAIQVFRRQRRDDIPSKEPNPITPNPQFPEPGPIEIGGRRVGTVIGRYYDGCAPGFQLKEIPVPPHSIAVTVRDDQVIGDLEKFSGAQIARDMSAFIRKPDNAVHLTITPVFHNASDNEFPLCIVKTNPFRPEDKDKLLMLGGTVWNVPPDYKPLRCVR